MKEYCIFIRHGQACPFIFNKFDNFYKCKESLEILLNNEEQKGNTYYVDNYFFDNKYSFFESSTYYCIKMREVSNWEKFSEDNYNLKNTKKSKILNFHEYII